ncbi:MAG: hypothetical protein AAFO95_12745 [Cyanobacteria bacterium J06600_6]
MITLDAIADLLDRNDIGYHFTPTKNSLIIYSRFKEFRDRPIGLRIIHNGEILEINAAALFQLKDKVFKNLLMEKLLKIQNTTTLLKFYILNVGDEGEWIGAAINYPLGNLEFWDTGAIECIRLLISSLAKNHVSLQHMLATGQELIEDLSPRKKV